jgi:hypothetical protein
VDTQFCTPLVEALLAGIQKRFGNQLEDRECQLAAAFHPKFKLYWLEAYECSQIDRVKREMVIAVETEIRGMSVEGHPDSSEEDDEDDFFSFYSTMKEQRHEVSSRSKAQALVKVNSEIRGTMLRNTITY